MPVYRDARNGRWFFKTPAMMHFDGSRKRLFGTPGVPGAYQDLPNSKVGAQEAERRAIGQVMAGPITEAKEAPKRKTIREHAETFVDTYKPSSKASEKREKRRVLKSHLLPFFGEMTIEGLKQTDIDTFAAAELVRGMAPKTVSNRLAVLSTLIRYATGEKSKLRFMQDEMPAELAAVPMDDVNALLAAAEDPRYRAVVLLAAEAGLRAGEIRGLQWTDIKSGQLTVRRALDKATNESTPPKHNKLRTVPLSQRLMAALRDLPRRGVWVIAEADGSAVTYDRLSETINAMYVCARVVRPPKPIHCLRHTFGTEMAKRVPLHVLQKLMGHADIKTTLRYVDVDEGQKRDAIATVFGVSASSQQRTNDRSVGTTDC